MSEDNALDSDVSIGPKPIGGVIESDEDEPTEYLGHIVSFTTGELQVDREWLVERWHSLDLPKGLMPKKVSEWRAYRRAINAIEDWEGASFSTYSDEYDHSFAHTLELEKSNDFESNNVYILYAKTFWPERIIGEENGDWKHKRLGYFDFRHGEDDAPGGIVPNMEIEKDDAFFDRWMKTYKQLKEYYRNMQESNNGQDMRSVVSDFVNDYANTVQIRRAVYFVPANRSGEVQSLSKIWKDMNQFKARGEKCEVASIPVINTKNQREMIEERAKEMMNESVDDIISTAFERFDVEDEADVIASEIMDSMGELESFGAQYNQLLQAKMSVKDILKERMGEVTEEKEKVLQKAIDQKSLEDY